MKPKIIKVAKHLPLGLLLVGLVLSACGDSTSKPQMAFTATVTASATTAAPVKETQPTTATAQAPTAQVISDNNLTNASSLGQELVGQVFSADNSRAQTSLKIVGVETRNAIQQGDVIIKPTGMFVVVLVDVASLGKDASDPAFNMLQLTNDQGRTFSYAGDPEAQLSLNRLDPQKYPIVTSGSPGFTRRSFVVYDVPRDVTNLKAKIFSPFVSLDSTRRPKPEDFQNSGGAGPDSGAGPELVGQGVNINGADLSVTKVERLSQITSQGQTVAKTEGVYLLVSYRGEVQSSNRLTKIVDGLGRPYHRLLFLGTDFDLQKNYPDSDLFEVPKDAVNFTLQSGYIN